MALRKAKSSSPDKVEQNMTPMIDIVFQLLTFFLMSFKIATAEGDFNIKMPLGQSSGLPQDDLPPIKLRLTADAAGNLNGLTYNGQRLVARTDAKGQPDFGYGDLHARILSYVGNDRGPNGPGSKAEVELDCDYGLRYEYVVRAITAVSGYRDSNGNVIKLMEKVKFAQPRKAG